MAHRFRFESLPLWVGAPLRFMPPLLLGRALSQLAIRLRQAHPELMERMGPYANVTFLIDPTDLPVVFRVRPGNSRPVACFSRLAPAACDARIAAPLAVLLAMIQGTLDGDALFFSRDMDIEGDTEAVLALRNAIDSIECDFASECAAQWGPLRPLAENAARGALRLLEYQSGVTLLRPAA